MRPRFALALDIDGVFLRGKNVIEDCAIAAIERIQAERIPHVFVTNGGGMLESEKAQDLSKKLKTKIHASQIILAHTPFIHFSTDYKVKRVLVLGKPNCLEVMKNYGFSDVVSAACLHAELPELYPMRDSIKQSKSVNNKKSNVAAAFIVHDPIDWALEMQVLTDCLLGGDPFGDPQSTVPQIPLYACNADLVYMSSYPHPRYTQGAFLEAFKTIHEKYVGRAPDIRWFGKPFSVQYRLAEERLALHAKELGWTLPATQFIGIGDNPHADVRGANDAGEKWRSVLVRTGVYRGGKDAAELKQAGDTSLLPDLITDDVKMAVEVLLQPGFDLHLYNKVTARYIQA